MLNNFTNKVSDDEKRKLRDKQAMQRILKRRMGIRFFKNKDDECMVMIVEAIEALLYIFDTNERNLRYDLKFPFKYTPKEIQDIKDCFEEASSNWEILEHSPVWHKHYKWTDEALLLNDRKKPIAKKYNYFRKKY